MTLLASNLGFSSASSKAWLVRSTCQGRAPWWVKVACKRKISSVLGGNQTAALSAAAGKRFSGGTLTWSLISRNAVRADPSRSAAAGSVFAFILGG